MPRRKKGPSTFDKYRRRKELEKRGAIVDGTTPLRRSKRESFAQRYVRSVDPRKSAREAGYSEYQAKHIWPYLVTDRHVQARLRVLLQENVAPAARASEVLDTLRKAAFTDTSNLVRISSRTGKVSYDLRGATAAQLNALRITQSTRRVGGKAEETVTITPADRSHMLSIIARGLGAYETDNSNEELTPMGEMIMEINWKTSQRLPEWHPSLREENGQDAK